MIAQIVSRLKNPAELKHFFYTGELLLIALFAVGIWFLRPKGPKSNFRVRESDLRNPPPGGKQNGKIDPSQDELANARLPKHEPLRLTGIRIDGRPFEILGVSPTATPAEIQKAYRELMKTYHPDRVGRPGSREWKDAQKIAEAINHAKVEMLKNKQK